MLPEDGCQLGGRPLEIPRKALAHLRESGVSGLKDATLDFGLEYIGLERAHAVCGLVTDRLARTREALQRLNPSESGPLGQGLGLLPISSVCTLGVSLLGRTEAIFDHWLTLTAGPADCVDGGENSEGEDAAPHVPRPIPGGIVLRTLRFRISRKAVVHFTLLGIQETCNAALQCLASSDVLKMLARRLRPPRLEDRSSRRVLAERAGRLAHQGCERILGDAATMRLLDIVSRLLGRWLGSLVETGGQGFGGEEADLNLQLLEAAQASGSAPDGSRLQVHGPAEEPQAQPSPEVALELVSGPNGETPGERFQLVVKNSFIEVLEEPETPSNIRRTRSLDGIAGKQGSTEVFTLVVNCVGPAARSRPRGADARGHPPSASSTAGQERSGTAPAPERSSTPSAASRPSPPPHPGGPQAREEGSSQPSASGRPPPPSSRPPPPPPPGGPREQEARAAEAEDEGHTESTTVILKGIPSSCTTATVLELLDARGFEGQYAFVYAPVDFARGSGLGYAVISLATHAAALRLMGAFDGVGDWGMEDGGGCTVSWNEPHQGLEALIDRYRNSPVMHPSVNPAHRPAVFADGQRIPFPEPTRAVRAPRVRHVRHSQEAGQQR